MQSPHSILSHAVAASLKAKLRRAIPVIATAAAGAGSATTVCKTIQAKITAHQ